MLANIGKRWWLTIIFAFPMAFLGLVTAAYINYNSTPMYIGRVTIMEPLGHPMKNQPDYYKMRLGNLGNLATGDRVLSEAAQTLSDLGLKVNPAEILAHTSVTPIKDTSILAIEVILPDAKEAKIAADVIAAETKKEYALQYGKPGDIGSNLKTIDPAYVYPVDQHHPLKLLLGLIGGFFFGIILGLIVAAVLPSRNNSEYLSPQQGV